ncbi:hypothetical protein WJX72_001861 [[Myrmecia] bisecta]|uniref:Uncharacterized protein n=1 Tax=[Myrmecia] bisecta TaxID=41462 RepID=A0AAW1QP48_9CHLO
MPSKRKVAERPCEANEPSAQASRSSAPETLADVSGKGLDSFLDRARQRSGRRPGRTAQIRGLAPAPAPTPAAGSCGAPALVFADKDKAPPAAASRDGAAAAAAEAPAGPAEHAAGPADASAGPTYMGAAAGEREEEEEWEWEAAQSSGEGEEWEDADDPPDPDRDASGVLSIDIDPAASGASGAPAKRRKRPPSAEERAVAKLVHQAHLLCLLARGRMQDQAASDPMLQALVLSLADPKLLPHNHPSHGVATDSLGPLAAWFRDTFKLLSTDEATKQAASNGDGPSTSAVSSSNASLKVDGLEGLLERLRSVAMRRAGTAEELVTLLAALLRAHGLLVRTIRALDALPMRLGTKPFVPTQMRRKPHRADAVPLSRLHSADVHRGSIPAEDAEEDPRFKGRPQQQGRPPQHRGKMSLYTAQSLLGTLGARMHKQHAAGRTITLTPGQRESAAEAIALTSAALGSAPFALDSPPSLDQINQVVAMGRSLEAQFGAMNGTAGGGATWWREGGGREEGTHWLEVYCGSAENGRWVHLDPLLLLFDQPLRMERATVRNAPLSYVVAFAGQGAKDVTQRYVASFAAAEKLRDGKWWEQTLKPLRASEVAATQQHHRAQHVSGMHSTAAGSAGAGIGGGGGNAGAAAGASAKGMAAAEEMRRKREDEELREKITAEKRALPTTIDGFRRHTAFVLERHISKYQALKPGAKKAGLHRGEAYYARGDLVELHTAELWLRAGRQVKAEEVEKPFKTAKKRNHKGGSKPATMDAAEEEDDAELGSPSTSKSPEPALTRLYGEWQTSEWRAPVATGGVVPKNEHGNVLCPPFAAALPEGTVHLRMPRLGFVCRQLKMDYAVAMCGFEMKGGHSVPVLDGVVVCQEHQEAVLEAYLEEERKREERAVAKQRQEAESNWHAVMRALFARIRVHNAYTGPASTNGDAAAVLQSEAAPRGSGGNL